MRILKTDSISNPRGESDGGLRMSVPERASRGLVLTDNIEFKICSKCGCKLPISDFRQADNWCRNCFREYGKKYRKENHEQILNRQEKYRQAFSESISDYNKKYYKKNREILLPRHKKYQKKYNQRPEVKAANRVRDFVRRSPLNIDPKLTADDWEKILALWNNRCAYCGAEGDLQQDHIIPVSKGGKHDLANVIPSCRKCNMAKGDKSINELSLKIREVIERHYKLLGMRIIPKAKQGRLYASFPGR